MTVVLLPYDESLKHTEPDINIIQAVKSTDGKIISIEVQGKIAFRLPEESGAKCRRTLYIRPILVNIL